VAFSPEELQGHGTHDKRRRVQSSMRMVADSHRLEAYHNKHCWRAFLGYQHRWRWM